MMQNTGAKSRVAYYSGGAILAGTVMLCLYVYEAVYLPWGESDQSLLYWYSPLLMFGSVSMLTGIVLFLYVRK